MKNVYNNQSNSIRTLHESELSSVTGGHPVVVGALAVVGAYHSGKAIGRGIKDAYNWAKDKLS